jgi:integrase/recombinase XerD
MNGSLFDGRGNRKYLIARERRAFVCKALEKGGKIATFCLTLAFTGARISEVLALTPERLDGGDHAIVLETLKRRKKGIFRAIPVPSKLLKRLYRVHAVHSSFCDPKARLWTWSRTTAWQNVKSVLYEAGVREPLATPRAVRHAFGVDAVQNGVALNILQRWMGHARIETTAIYANVIGREERALARRTWRTLEKALGA